MEVNAKRLWTQVDRNKVDVIFEHMINALLSLKQKIKDGTATHEECNQALALVNQLNVTDLLPLEHVNVLEEDMQEHNPGLLLSAPSEITEDTRGDFSFRMEVNEKTYSRSEGESAERSSKFSYHNHICSKKCLSQRPWDSFKGENPLKLPMLCHFQRWHAKADSELKSHDVIYKAPCGRSLRNFQEVQSYLFQTECSFLSIDHFSFNTYVQVFRSSPSSQACVFDSDISKGAETVPVSFCNDINQDRPSYFKYRKTPWPHGCFLNNFSSTFLDSCNCTDGCVDRTKCACLLLTERSFMETLRKGPSNGYNYKRLDEPISSGIYECSLLCSCDKIMCQNRLVQHGLQVRLQVFSTEKKGWGVRCLDDIDKGTFVCTYAGRLMIRDESWQVKSSGETEEEVTENRSHVLFSRKRKLGTISLDSKNEFIQNPGRQKSLHLNAKDQPNVIQNHSSYKIWNKQAITRPKTKTSILQRHRHELGIIDGSSDEDENSLCQKSATRTPTFKKRNGQSSLQGELEELVNPVQSKASTDCHKENLLSNAVLKNKSALQKDRWIKKRDKDLLCSDHTEEGEVERNRQALTRCKEVAELETCPKNKGNPCLLDATKEGNVGRFLNHSCSPNLFVQSVFVETHNRIFPWVAFFTKRHVRAGTELTWDYGYEAGSMPEIETTCQCEALVCRKKIL